MPLKDIVVIGASTGKIEATKVLASELPRGFQRIDRIGRNGLGLLPEIFERAGSLPASNAKD